MDLIDGFKHLSDEERQSLIGKQVCVFMLRGLFSNWKYVLNYFVTDTSIEGSEIKKIIEKNLRISKSVGIRVRAICCDQGPSNRKAHTLFGVTYKKPYSIVNGEKIFFFFDVPHLIKSVRNNFIGKKILKTPDGWAKWEHILTIFSEDSKSELIKRCPKLTQSHIAPNTFEKMKVSFATQVLSKSVAAALKDLTNQKIINDQNNATFNFILNMNNLFDILNIRSDGKFAKDFNLKGNSYKNLKDLQKYMLFIAENNSKQMYCLFGFCQVIEAMFGLMEEISGDPELQDENLLTARLNQDPIENLFAQVRSREAVLQTLQ